MVCVFKFRLSDVILRIYEEEVVFRIRRSSGISGVGEIIYIYTVGSNI